MPISPTPSTVRNIQALRGIAALLVLFAHIKFVILDQVPDYPMPAFLDTAYGAIGVDIFFVISGYVISLTAIKKHHDPLNFLAARIGRVAPLYLAVSLPYILKRFIHWPHLPWRSIWNSLFYLPIFDMGTYTPPQNTAGWTLSFEMWFYCVFAFLLIFMKPVRASILLPVVFFIGAIPFSFYNGAWFFPHLIFHPLALEFGLGCLIFQFQSRITLPMATVFLVLAAIGLIFIAPRYDDVGWHLKMLEHIEIGWTRLLVWGLPSALLVAGMVGLERNGGYVFPLLMFSLGEISYSLYLIQEIAMSIFRFSARHLGMKNAALLSVSYLIFAVFLAWLCWLCVEKPLTALAKKWLHAEPQPRSRPEAKAA